MAEKLPNIIRFRVTDELAARMDAKVGRRRLRQPGWTLSDYLRGLIEADLEGAKPLTDAERVQIAESEADSDGLVAVEVPEAPNLADLRAQAAEIGLQSPETAESGSPGGWMTSQEPDHVDDSGVAWFSAPHLPKGDGFCRGGCDIDVDMTCMWPRDHPDRPENRKKRR